MARDRWYRQHAHLQRRMRQQNSRLVDVWRGGVLLFSVYMTTFELRINELIEFGVSLDVRRIDYIVTLADIGPAYEPKVGDRFVDQKNQTTARVSPLNEAIFRWESADRKVLRLHTHLETWVNPSSEGGEEDLA